MTYLYVAPIHYFLLENSQKRKEQLKFDSKVLINITKNVFSPQDLKVLKTVLEWRK